MDWKPAAAPAPAPAPAGATVITTAVATAAAKMGASSSFFSVPLAPITAHVPAQPIPGASSDDLEKYLALPPETDLDLDVLAWWKARDHGRAAWQPGKWSPCRLAAPGQDGTAVSWPPGILGWRRTLLFDGGQATQRPQEGTGGRHSRALPLRRCER